MDAAPLWDTLTEQARRQGLAMTAAAARRSCPTSAVWRTATGPWPPSTAPPSRPGPTVEARLPVAAQRLLRRPGRHVPRRHQGQRHGCSSSRPSVVPRSSRRACSAGTTCARPPASSSSTSPSTSGPSSSGPPPPFRRSRPMTEKRSKDVKVTVKDDDPRRARRPARPSRPRSTSATRTRTSRSRRSRVARPAAGTWSNAS